MNDENKEELEKKVKEEEEVKVEENVVNEENKNSELEIDTEETVEKEEKVENEETSTQESEEVKQEEATQEVSKEQEKEPEKDSEVYYDEIDYQDKEATEEVKAKTRSVLREVFDWILCFVIAYVIYLNINYFIISAPGVKQQSMYPTIMSGERVLVLRPWLAFRDYEYGDIVTFEAPIDNKYYIDSEETFPTAQYENYEGITLFLYKFMDVNKTNYIKRVIGLPGDHIVVKDGNVYRNDELLDEPYIRVKNTEIQDEKYCDVVVPEGTMYVMGDNRESSLDSRTFGCIPFERVNGHVLCRLWPLNKLGSIE